MIRLKTRVLLSLLVACLIPGMYAFGASPILEGDYLRVGVSESGGLIDDGFTVGIDYDKTGTSSWTAYDFLKPGTPFEFYSIGVDGDWDAAGYDSGNPFGATTTDTSAGTTNSAVTLGGFGDVKFTQRLAYDDISGTVNFVVELENTSASASHDVVYARGLDPDQDVYAGGGYETTNTIVSDDLVTGSAPVTDWTIGIYTDSAFTHVPTIQESWDQNPYNLLTPWDDGDGDWTINMAWDLGSLAPGEAASIAFQYRIAETAEEVVNPTPGTPTIPAPGAVVLGVIGSGLVGWFRRRGAL